MIKVIEQHLQGKTNEALQNEDDIILGKNTVAIVDGVTAKSGRLFRGKTSGMIARELIRDALFSETISNLSAEQLFKKLDERFQQFNDANAISFFYEGPRASVILYNAYFREVWSYGDCQCMIGESIYQNRKRIDDLTGAVRSFVNSFYLANGAAAEELRTDDKGRAFILPLLQMQILFENEESAYGYPVINGKGINPNLIRKYPVNIGEQVILASDGYPQLFATLAETEAALKKVIKNDPLLIDPVHQTKGVSPGNCSFDDRAYIRFVDE